MAHHEARDIVEARLEKERLVEASKRFGNRCPVCKKLTVWKGPMGGSSYDANLPKHCYACVECGVVFYGVSPTNLVEVDGVLAKA